MDGDECLRRRYRDGWSLKSYFAIYSKFNTTLLRGFMIALYYEMYTLSRIRSLYSLTHSVYSY